MMRGCSDPLSCRKIVQFDHDTVNLVVEIVPLLVQAVVVLQDIIHHLHPSREVTRGEPPATQGVQRLHLRFHRGTLDAQDFVREDIEWSLRRGLWIQLSEPSGSRVSRIRERLPTLSHEPFVQLLERGNPHYHLDAHGQEGRHLVAGVAQPERHCPDRPNVVGDPFPDLAIPSGGRTDQRSVLIDKFHGGAVEFRLHHVRDVVTHELANAFVESAERALLPVGVETEHRCHVRDGGKAVQRGGGTRHPLCRGVRCTKLRVRFFELLQLTKERIVRLIRYFGRISHMIQVVVMANLGADFPDPGLDLIPILRHTHSGPAFISLVQSREHGLA